MAAKEKIEELLIVNRRTGKALQSTGLDNGLPVAQATPDAGDAQVWQLVKTPAGIKVVNKASGKVLDVMQGSTEAGAWVQTWEDVGGESQLWQMEKVTPTYKKIVNIQSGKVLDIVDMREDDGAPLQIWDDVEGVGQQWKTVKAETIRAKVAKAAAQAEKAPAKAATKTVTKKAAATTRTTRKTAAKK